MSLSKYEKGTQQTSGLGRVDIGIRKKKASGDLLYPLKKYGK
jgi:hypothetical protein